MSKQSEAKKEQGYVDKKPIQCSTCQHFKFDHVQTQPPSTWSPNGLWEDKNIRCGIGDFAVKKTARCEKHEFKKACK